MKVSVVVVNWNGANKLQRFLPKILQLKSVDEFIVVDDASTDNSVELVQKGFSEVKIVRRSQNGGFSSNANSGVAAAAGDLVFLLNPDAVPATDCINLALPYFSDAKVFSVGCNTGGNWSWAKWENGFFWHFMTPGEPLTHETMWARGGSGIFRKQIFDELGGMDELMDPYYEEDMDLGYRAIKRGYKNLWVKECRVALPPEKGVIEENIPREKFSRTAQRNQLIFIWKNIHDNELIAKHRQALVKLLLTQPKYWLVFLGALSKLSWIIKKRQVERAAARISDKEILKRQFGTI